MHVDSEYIIGLSFHHDPQLNRYVLVFCLRSI